MPSGRWTGALDGGTPIECTITYNRSISDPLNRAGVLSPLWLSLLIDVRVVLIQIACSCGRGWVGEIVPGRVHCTYVRWLGVAKNDSSEDQAMRGIARQAARAATLGLAASAFIAP